MKQLNGKPSIEALICKDFIDYEIRSIVCDSSQFQRPSGRSM